MVSGCAHDDGWGGRGKGGRGHRGPGANHRAVAPLPAIQVLIGLYTGSELHGGAHLGSGKSHAGCK